MDNIKAQPYQSVLVTAGLHDPRVAYWEPAKVRPRFKSADLFQPAWSACSDVKLLVSPPDTARAPAAVGRAPEGEKYGLAADPAEDRTGRRALQRGERQPTTAATCRRFVVCGAVSACFQLHGVVAARREKNAHPGRRA